MPPSTRTSSTAGETADDAAGTTGVQDPAETKAKKESQSSGTPNSLRFSGASVTKRVFTKKDLQSFDESYDGDDIVFDHAVNGHRVSTDGLPEKVVNGLLRQPNIKGSTAEV